MCNCFFVFVPVLVGSGDDPQSVLIVAVRSVMNRAYARRDTVSSLGSWVRKGTTNTKMETREFHEHAFPPAGRRFREHRSQSILGKHFHSTYISFSVIAPTLPILDALSRVSAGKTARS